MKLSKTHLLLIFICTVALSGIPFVCTKIGKFPVREPEWTDTADSETASVFFVPTEEDESEDTEEDELKSLVIPEGKTLCERIAVPDGYVRIPVEEKSFAKYMRDYTMKEDQSPVLLYNGEQKWNQSAHVAVFTLPVSSHLQQCADTIMRLYSEYFWENGQYDRISFAFTGSFSADYSKWRDGYRIKVNGKSIRWVYSGSYDDSFENLQKYLRIVYAYSGTLSMNNYETMPVTMADATIGDVFIKGGSPGHVIMIVDVCENEEGKRAFLLAQGSMPAQEFHVLKNEIHPEDPWYYEDEIVYPFITPEYTFDEGSLKRLKYDCRND